MISRYKILLLSFMAVISLLLCSFAPPANCSVSFHGIYAIKLDEEHSAVLRFYEDGTVLASTSVNDYMDVFTWFHKENQSMVLSGKYKIKKCLVKFDVSGMTGKQHYDGTIEGNSIRFLLTDESSKKAVERTYTFFAL